MPIKSHKSVTRFAFLINHVFLLTSFQIRTIIFTCQADPIWPLQILLQAELELLAGKNYWPVSIRKLVLSKKTIHSECKPSQRAMLV